MPRVTNSLTRGRELALEVGEFSATVGAYRATLSRLLGIIDRVDKDKSTADLIHRVRTIAGYKKQTLKMARTLAESFGVFDRILAELEG